MAPTNARRSINKLSARTVATEKKPGRHSDGGGLYLLVTEAGGRKWVFRYTINGKTTDLGFGSARDVSLADAREKAATYRGLVAKGIDPRVEHRREATPTFGEFADKYIEDMRPAWRSKTHLAQWTMTLRDYAAPLRPLRVDAIKTEDVVEALRPIWASRPDTGYRLRGRIENVLDAAKAKSHRTGENPARWRGHLENLLPGRKRVARAHHAAMAFDDVPAFMKRLRGREAVAAKVLEFTILTASRSGEVLGARWNEIDLKAKVWTIPSHRMKGGREHRVPLSDRAVELVEEMRQFRRTDADLVFPGQRNGRPLSGMAMSSLLKRMKLGITVHGFRSSFRDWAGDRTSFARDTVEASLAHAIADRTEAAYRRSDALEKRRALMTAWAAFLDFVPKDNVVPLSRSG